MSGPWRAPSRLWIVLPVATMAAAVALAAAMRADAPGAGAGRRLDHLAAEVALDRCREEGEGALDDPACRSAWAAARRRFLGLGP